MILRVFAARLRPGRRADYERLCREKSVPWMRSQPGFLTYWMGPSRSGRANELVFVSVWRDLESIQSFAGERWQEASILPGEAELLEAVSVRHFDESYRSLTEMWRACADVVKRREVEALRAPLTDEQWARIRPLIPPTGRRGRPRADDRATLDGALYVLRSGCRWGDIPREYGSAVTCWRRFARWEADGTWERIWAALLATLDTPGKQAWALAFVDGRRPPTKRERRPNRRAGAPTRAG